MLKSMRRGLFSLILVMLSLCAGAPLTGSQQAQRIQAAPITPDSNSATFALARQNTPPPPSAEQPVPSSATEELSGRTVVLDPAHGGADFGARGPTGLAESDVVLDFARAARIALEAQRIRVLLTREGNQDPTFNDRSALVNGLHNVVFISLHVSSSGPVGTARAYYYLFPGNPGPQLNLSPSAAISAPHTSSALPASQNATPPTAARAGSLVEWDHAQQGSIDLSRQLAAFVQTELLHRFKGSPEMPIAAPVRQLRTIAAPAIAIEISSIDVTDAKRLDQMAQPLAEAIGRAVAEFAPPPPSPAPASNGAPGSAPGGVPSGANR
jgi:N-acetylmuramoyl-L-alanine amidase